MRLIALLAASVFTIVGSRWWILTEAVESGKLFLVFEFLKCSKANNNAWSVDRSMPKQVDSFSGIGMILQSKHVYIWLLPR